MLTSADIKFVSNWGYWYELDGKRMSGDYPVQVLWSDGSVTDAILRAVPGILRYTDHGHEGQGSDDKLVLVRIERGVEWQTAWKPQDTFVSFTFLF